MIPNLILIIIILVGVAQTLILIMFLPALFELKKPKDAGPRAIVDSIPEVKMLAMHIIPIANIEKDQKFDVPLIQTIAKIIEFLPRLEV